MSVSGLSLVSFVGISRFVIRKCGEELVAEYGVVWSPGGAMRKIITLIRAHGLLNRAHGLLNRAHGLIIRAHGLIIRAHGLLSRAHGLLSRAHGLGRLNNYFPHGTAGTP